MAGLIHSVVPAKPGFSLPWKGRREAAFLFALLAINFWRAGKKALLATISFRLSLLRADGECVAPSSVGLFLHRCLIRLAPNSRRKWGSTRKLPKSKSKGVRAIDFVCLA